MAVTIADLPTGTIVVSDYVEFVDRSDTSESPEGTSKKFLFTPADVVSVFGRIGIVVATLNDYDASLVNNDSGVTGATVAAALNTLDAASGVSSFETRTGVVVAALNDYDASLVNNDSTVVGSTVKDALETLEAGHSAVDSVFSRTGSVVATLNDYSASLVDNDSTVTGTTVANALDTLKTTATEKKVFDIVATASQTIFPLGATATFPTLVSAFRNGQQAIEGVGNDFTVSGSTLTWIGTTLSAGQRISGFFDESSAGAAPIVSVFGRIEDVVATASDYDASQVDNDSGVTGAFVSNALDTLDGQSGVTSVYTRTGAVVATSGDYTSTLVTNASGVSGADVTAALNTLDGQSGVTSVYTRTGAVVAALSDYDASQVDNDSSVSGATVKDALDTLDTALGTSITVYFTFAHNSTDGNHPVLTLTTNASSEFGFAIPDDFNALVSLEMIMSPTGGAAGTGKDVDLSSSYGGVGEVTNFHSETDTVTTYNFGTAGVFAFIDVSSVFSSLSAGDICGFTWDNQAVGGTINLYRIKLVYTR